MVNIPQTFRFRLAAMFGCLSLLIGVALTIYIDRVASQHLSEARGAMLQEVARSISTALSENLLERRREIELLSRFAQFSAVPWQAGEIRQVLEATKDSYRSYAWLGLADAAGTVVAATGGLLEGAEVSRRPWFTAGQQGAFLGDVHEAVMLARLLPQGNGKEPLRFIDFAVPVHDREGLVRGVLAAHADWAWVASIFAAAMPREDSAFAGLEAFVIGEHNQILHPFESAGELDPTDQGHYLTARATVRVAAANGLHWQILVRQPVEMALSPVARLHRELLAMGLAAAALFVILAYRLAIGFSRPFEHLARVARNIERGDETADFEVPGNTREVQDMADALRGMVGRLSTRRKALEQSNATLEQKVVERTAELEQHRNQLEIEVDRRARQVLEKEAVFRNLFASVPLPLGLIDPDGRIAMLNPSFVATFGYSPGELAHLEDWWVRAYPSADHRESVRQRWDAALQAALGSGSVMSPIEFDITCKDGTVRTMAIAGAPVGEQFLSYFFDVTERNRMLASLAQAKEAAEAASVAKTAFLGNMSHEMRTPLHQISGMAQLIGRDPLSPKQADWLGKLEGAVRRLTSIIDAILKFTDLEASRLAPSMADFNVRQQFFEIAALLHDRASEKGLLLLCEADQVPGRLLGDPGLIETALLCYANNAITYTSSGQVILRLKLLEDNPVDVLLRFEVEDTGMGIPPEAMGRLFSMFEQVDNSSTRQFGGTGLGLATTRKLARLMGGEVGCESQLGAGSVFWFTARLTKGTPVV